MLRLNKRVLNLRRFSTQTVNTTASVTASAATNAPRVKNFINGVFEESKANRFIPVINPATQEVVSYVPESTPDELKRAEEGAIAAFKVNLLICMYRPNSKRIYLLKTIF